MTAKILKQLYFKSTGDLEATDFSGIQTRNGDSITLYFNRTGESGGSLEFGFAGGGEGARVILDFRRKRLEFHTSDWRQSQPCHVLPLPRTLTGEKVLSMEKTSGRGNLIKNANIVVLLDGHPVLKVDGINILPEMGVIVKAKDVRVTRFVHWGYSSGMPEYFHLGGWQMLNDKSIRKNLDSLQRGLEQSAAAGVQLLVTSETSLTGLFPLDRVTKDRRAIAEAERELRRLLSKTKKAPYLVVGFPLWESSPGQRGRLIRYNVSRVYDPEGEIVSTHAKIHSCEFDFWHGYRLQEFNILGVPVSMHICHDTRYPEVWTLPIMFGARLILHPANSIPTAESIDAFEARAKISTMTSHTFYIHVNGGGRSYIAGPQKYNNLIAVSAECRRDVQSFPMVGPSQECLLHAKIRIADAFGYWPMRSFRASEEIASSYLALYRAMGGKRPAS